VVAEVDDVVESLVAAAEEGDVDTVQTILRQADVKLNNKRDARPRLTALVAAAAHGHLPVRAWGHAMRGAEEG
jgi:hypothetical protein